MKFELTEADAIRLTGYSRQQLQRLRLGGKQVQGGKVYATKPTIKKGKDWERYGTAVLYAEQVVGKLQQRKIRGVA